jgi:hypothetical protein
LKSKTVPRNGVAGVSQGFVKNRDGGVFDDKAVAEDQAKRAKAYP